MSSRGWNDSHNWFALGHAMAAALTARDRRRALRRQNAELGRNAAIGANGPIITSMALTGNTAITPAIIPQSIAPATTPVEELPRTRIDSGPTAITADNGDCQSLPPWEAECLFVGRHDQVAIECSELNSAGRALNLPAVADHEYLLDVFDVLRATHGPAPGPDRISYCDVSRSEAAEILRRIAGRIRDREYRPGPSRLVLIPKANRRYRALRLRCIVDRVVAAAVKRLLTPALEPIFLPSAMGFRPRQGVWTVIASIARTVASTGYAVITQDDVANAFPSVPVDDAIADYARHVSDDGLMWLVGAILRGDRTGAALIGIDQGCPCSPLTMNLRFHYALDAVQHAAGLGHPLAYRYVDNVAYLSGGVSDGKRCLEMARNALAPAFSLKGEGNLHVNLRCHGAHADVLGYRLRLVNDQIRVGLGGGAFRGLHKALRKAPLTDSPSQAARRAVLGWLGAAGPAIESVSATAIVGRVRRIAAQYGFRELGREAELEGALLGAHLKWHCYRDRIAQGGT
jgi:hypothetical protein